MRHRTPITTFALLLFAACTDPGQSVASAAPQGPPPPRQIALVPHQGDTPLDQQLRDAQQQARQDRDLAPRIERLAILYIQKARRASDPGFYKLAEQCAAWLDQVEGGGQSAALVRGHVLHSLHRFAEAEVLARRLAGERGLFLDHGLLGDVLYDLGRTEDATASYQRMLDLKPCLQSYSRAAQVAWLRGDRSKARELLELARNAGSARDPESLAWVEIRLAQLALGDGDVARAEQACAAALQLLPYYAMALHARGLLRAATGRLPDAIEDLAAAATASSLPEHHSALIAALREAGRTAEADAAEAALLASGEREDPRSFAVFLASAGIDLPRALRLTETELGVRQDVLTHDARAFVLLHAGRIAEASVAADAALAAGTRDGRLFLHTGAVALAAGDRHAARARLQGAHHLRLALDPAERRLLARLRAELGEG